MATAEQRAAMRPELLDVVEYRKSGLSLNHIVGCPLDCGYCVRHLFGNFAMKQPRALMSDGDAVDLLTGHRFFQPHLTPIQIFNRATDPMLPMVKLHTFATLRLLDQQGLTNHVLVITRYRVEPADCSVFNSVRNLKLTILVTHSGIDDPSIEPVDSAIAAESQRTLYAHAHNYRTIVYWRPIVPGLNDTDTHLARARELSHHAHATVFTGLFFRDEIRDYYRAHGIPEPYEDTARRKVFPSDLEQRILAAFADRPGGSPLFRKTSCGIAYVHRLADYNGHVGIRELCDICPTTQHRRCTDEWQRPDTEHADQLATELGGTLVDVTDRAVITRGLDEQRRYYIQHTLGYQVHDAEKPHHPRRHGRADLGWPTKEP